jgi:SAM-dependent methyltransferase
MWRQYLSRALRLIRRGASPQPEVLEVGKAAGRDYEKNWILKEGKKYRDVVYRRQSATGSRPLISNPTYDEMRAVFDTFSARRLLEVGCGWGRILEALHPYYEIEGCDISDDYLSLVKAPAKAFKLDVINPPNNFLEEHAGGWDVVFCRGVMLYLDRPQIRKAMENMAKLASKRVVIWEWPHVCRIMHSENPDPKFNYTPIKKIDE